MTEMAHFIPSMNGVSMQEMDWKWMKTAEMDISVEIIDSNGIQGPKDDLYSIYPCGKNDDARVKDGIFQSWILLGFKRSPQWSSMVVVFP
jgi:predicted proteasome-type protease